MKIYRLSKAIMIEKIGAVKLKNLNDFLYYKSKKNINLIFLNVDDVFNFGRGFFETII